MTRPQDMDGEPWEVAAKAVAQAAKALAEVIGQFEATEAQVRNARMQDALELSPAELHDQYPEAVNEYGILRSSNRRPSDEPYEFWAATHDAALIERVGYHLGRAAADAAALEERQPEVERNAD